MFKIETQVLKKVIERAGGKEKLKKQFRTIDKWLSGERVPTFKQLEELSKLSGIPFGDIILGKIPEPLQDLDITFFRRNQNVPPSVELEKLVRATYNRVSFASEYLEKLGYEPLKFIGNLSLDDDIEEAAKYVKELLKLEADWIGKIKTKREALAFLRERLENIGIFAFMGGYLENNTHAKLNPDEFKGFSIVDKLAPAIFVNTNTYLATQMFTLVHEFIHILLGESAISELSDEDILFSNSKVEQFCNKVTAAVLVPEEELVGIPNEYEAFDELSKKLKVSPLVIIIRASEKGFLNRQSFNNLLHQYHEKLAIWFEEQEKKKESERKGTPDWYTLKKFRLGKRFLSLAIAAFQEGGIPPNYFYSLTGVKINKIERLQGILE